MRSIPHAALISVSLAMGALSLFCHGQLSIALAAIASMIMLILLGKSKAIAGAFILIILVGSSIGVDYIIENLPIFIPFSSNRPYEARSLKYYLKDFEMLEKPESFYGIETLEVLGRNIEITFESSEGVSVSEGMYFKKIGKRLEVYSKNGGRISLSNLKHLEIDGYNISVTGKGSIETLEINGMDNNISFEDNYHLSFELNGFSNSVDLTLNNLGNFEINGASNLVKLRFKSTAFGRVRVEISGTGNNVKVLLDKNSHIRIEKELHPSFMNDLQVIKDDND